MADEKKTTSESQSGGKSSGSSDKSDVVKATQADLRSPEQKHKDRLDDIERLHNEP